MRKPEPTLLEEKLSSRNTFFYINKCDNLTPEDFGNCKVKHGEGGSDGE